MSDTRKTGSQEHTNGRGRLSSIGIMSVGLVLIILGLYIIFLSTESGDNILFFSGGAIGFAGLVVGFLGFMRFGYRR